MTKSFLNSISLRTISRSSYLPQAKPPLSHAIYVNPDKLKAFPFKSLVKIKFGHNKNSTCRIYEEKIISCRMKVGKGHSKNLLYWVFSDVSVELKVSDDHEGAAPASVEAWFWFGCQNRLRDDLDWARIVIVTGQRLSVFRKLRFRKLKYFFPMDLFCYMGKFRSPKNNWSYVRIRTYNKLN